MSARLEIKKFLQQEAEKPLSPQEIAERFDVSREQRDEFEEVLESLVREGFIHRSSRGLYGVPEKFNLLRGRVDRNPKGFAFLIPDNPEKEDVFINPDNLNGAMNNDKVLVRFLPHSHGKKDEGEVVKILERANEHIVGVLDSYKRYGFVIPDNQRINTDVFVPQDEFKGADDRDKVVVKITRWPERNRNPEGKIVEVLGKQGESGVDLEALIRQLDLPQEFPGKVVQAAENLSSEIPSEEIERRRDLRDLRLFTIDPEEAKDFDDAVSIEKISDNKLRLGVHIADVSYYVEEDSKIDKEAFKRGTSIYLVDRVIPMLPERLSNDLCSLRPREDRLAMSVFMEYNLEPFELEDYEITESIINSNYRLTYDEARQILEDEDQDIRKEYRDIVSDLELMKELREKLMSGRRLRGTIEFEFPEVKVILDDRGRAVDLQKREHGLPEQMIEVFMIAANRAVAREAYWREEPFIYRVHDNPDPQSIEEFNEFIHNFGYHIKGGESGEIHPGALQELLDEVSGTGAENIIETMMLRSMKKAVYSPVNIGHFGLSLDCYCHFTSPIRRYPDLMVHRIIKEIINQGKLEKERRWQLEDDLPEVADHCSVQERRALDAERDSVDLKRIEYMQQYVGDKFTGIINGVTSFGFFVQLENTAEGLVHVEDLTDDYYQYRDDLQALVGERKKKIYRLGDEVEVRVIKANVEERELDFVLADME
ncbi:ribonuclease R [Halarsenatibacter silvermanii]|uniref:ribonuclease R n=1 Tax=Halarsenatibacter silvermanii TaxID=321763 RepID=UPI000B7E820E|nr:ribonuclease R [Halarsenatibacter silvermanii]